MPLFIKDNYGSTNCPHEPILSPKNPTPTPCYVNTKAHQFLLSSLTCYLHGIYAHHLFDQIPHPNIVASSNPIRQLHSEFWIENTMVIIEKQKGNFERIYWRNNRSVCMMFSLRIRLRNKQLELSVMFVTKRKNTSVAV